MNHTQRWLAVVRPRHNPAENALVHSMRGDPNIPWLNSLAAMQYYARKDGSVPQTLGSFEPSEPIAATGKGKWRADPDWPRRAGRQI
jgi:hypothetical protein